MSKESFPFRVGSFECLVVSDGTYAYPYPARNVFINFFINAPKEHLERVLRTHNLDPERWEAYVSPYLCLVIDMGQHRVLVDTGAGSLAPTTGKLILNLRNEGIAPEDIDAVILTHGHPDHIGGTIDHTGKPAFPHACYVMWRDEWDFWTSDPHSAERKVDEHLITIARTNLLPIQDQLDLLDRETEIVPGIRSLAAPGHTPGHMAVAITSEGKQLLYLADTVIHPIHLERPDWYTAVATAPEQVVATRRRLLNRAATDKALVHAFHFPFPGLGHVAKKGEQWLWQPIETPDRS